MSIVYEWKVTQLQVAEKKDNLNSVVENVDWTLTATENDCSVSVSATTALNLPDPSLFIEYEKLTSDMVEFWAKNAMGGTVFDSYKTNLAVVLKEKQDVNSKKVTPPWK